MRRRTWVGAALGLALVAGSAVTLGNREQRRPTPPPLEIPESEIRTADIAFYEHRVAEDSVSAADRARLAGLYLQRARETGSSQDYDRVEALARESLALRSAHNADTYGLLTTARLAKHDFTGALRSARALYAADTTNASSRAQLAEVELEIGNYENAGRLFASVAAHADKPTIAARLARWYEITGRSPKARAILRRAATHLTSSTDVPREQLAWFHYRVGELEIRVGQFAAADSALKRALASFPNDYRALGALARLAATRGDWTTAVDYGARAIAVQLDPATLGTMSDAYAALGDSAQARAFAEAMAASALSVPGSIHRAWGLYLLDHDLEVERVLAEARSELKVRRDVYAYDLLAWALYKAGRLTEAKRAATAALAQGTEDAQLFYHGGMIAAAAGDSTQGRLLLGRAMALNPRFSATQAAIARHTLLALGNPE